MLKKLLSIIALVMPCILWAQDIDVTHYNFFIRLSDKSDTIEGQAQINFDMLRPSASVSFDLAGVRSNGKGMKVEEAVGAGIERWEQTGDKVVIHFDVAAIPKRSHLVQISYRGIPADGLIISKNKWGDRTFFADNWPNRAHQWIPCNDRPDDKASFEFLVSAPKQYDVISNGRRTSPMRNTDSFSSNAIKPVGFLTSWAETTPLSTKVMVIGAARFAMKTFDDSPAGIPVSAWVFPQDSTKGFYDYGVAPSILKFFSNYIAPFPYEKLANVQSKTIFGGMENASAIFYAEESVTGDRKWEDVLAHEIAHQWFGDMASEKSFAHLWLSEGFATYLTNSYIEHKYGVDSMRKRLATDRQQVIAFAKSNNHPVVDSTSNLMSLLNANSYQKGGWVLHMLRQEVGDAAFQKIIQAYYKTYKGRNADTRDFQQVAESVTGRKLDWFFDQWLYRPGVPDLECKLTLRKNDLELTITQNSGVYRLALEIGILPEGEKEMKVFKVELRQQNTTLTLDLYKDLGVDNGLKGVKNFRVLLDPDVKLLARMPVSAGNYFGAKRPVR